MEPSVGRMRETNTKSLDEEDKENKDPGFSFEALEQSFGYEISPFTQFENTFPYGSSATPNQLKNARQRKLSLGRRVSFADNLTIHEFARDEEYHTPPETKDAIQKSNSVAVSPNGEYGGNSSPHLSSMRNSNGSQLERFEKQRESLRNAEATNFNGQAISLPAIEGDVWPINSNPVDMNLLNHMEDIEDNGTCEDETMAMDLTISAQGEITKLVPKVNEILDGYSEMTESLPNGHTQFGLPGTPAALPDFLSWRNSTDGDVQSITGNMKMVALPDGIAGNDVEHFTNDGDKITIEEPDSPMELEKALVNKIEVTNNSHALQLLPVPVIIDNIPISFGNKEASEKWESEVDESIFPGFPLPPPVETWQLAENAMHDGITEGVPTMSQLLEADETRTMDILSLPPVIQFQTSKTAEIRHNQILGSKYLCTNEPNDVSKSQAAGLEANGSNESKILGEEESKSQEVDMLEKLPVEHLVFSMVNGANEDDTTVQTEVTGDIFVENFAGEDSKFLEIASENRGRPEDIELISKFSPHEMSILPPVSPKRARESTQRQADNPGSTLRKKASNDMRRKLEKLKKSVSKMSQIKSTRKSVDSTNLFSDTKRRLDTREAIKKARKSLGSSLGPLLAFKDKMESSMNNLNSAMARSATIQESSGSEESPISKALRPSQTFAKSKKQHKAASEEVQKSLQVYQTILSKGSPFNEASTQSAEKKLPLVSTPMPAVRSVAKREKSGENFETLQKLMSGPGSISRQKESDFVEVGSVRNRVSLDNKAGLDFEDESELPDEQDKPQAEQKEDTARLQHMQSELRHQGWRSMIKKGAEGKSFLLFFMNDVVHFRITELTEGKFGCNPLIVEETVEKVLPNLGASALFVFALKSFVIDGNLAGIVDNIQNASVKVDMALEALFALRDCRRLYSTLAFARFTSGSGDGLAMVLTFLHLQNEIKFHLKWTVDITNWNAFGQALKVDMVYGGKHQTLTEDKILGVISGIHGLKTWSDQLGCICATLQALIDY